MKYQFRDKVKLIVGRKYANGDVIPSDSKGTILKLHMLSVSYTVKFDGFKTPHRVKETWLTD